MSDRLTRCVVCVNLLLPEVVLDLDNVVGLLVASEMYELEALREMCKGFVLNHAHEVFRDPQIVQVPEKLLLEVKKACQSNAPNTWVRYLTTERLRWAACS